MITKFDGCPTDKDHPINNARGGLFDGVCREMCSGPGIYTYIGDYRLLTHESIMEKKWKAERPTLIFTRTTSF